MLEAQRRLGEDRFIYASAESPLAPYIPADPFDSGALQPDTHSVGRDHGWLQNVWRMAREAAARNASPERPQVLALDEIQNVPNWSEAVKALWDADRREGRHLHVVLAGSAPLLMQRGLTESLAGRFETIEFGHWGWVEMERAFDFDLEQYIFFGGYPGAAPYITDEGRWSDYVCNALIEPNIDRDILAMQRVDKPALLKHLFHTAVSHSAQIVSYTKLLGGLQDAGNTTTLARYLDLLGNARLVGGLDKFGHRPSMRRGSPKLNVYNTALVTARSGYRFAEARADRTFWGHLVESAVGAHLLNTASSGVAVRYWRHGGHEVDFVLSRGNRAVALEVKGGKKAASRRGHEAFRERFEHFGTVHTEVVGADGIPLGEFLAEPADRWLDR